MLCFASVFPRSLRFSGCLRRLARFTTAVFPPPPQGRAQTASGEPVVPADASMGRRSMQDGGVACGRSPAKLGAHLFFSP